MSFPAKTTGGARKRPTVILRAVEVDEIIAALGRLSAAEEVFGHVEDAKIYFRYAEILLNRLYGQDEARTLTGGKGKGF